MTDDPSAAVNPVAVPVVLSAMTGPLSWLIGFTAKGAGTDGVVAVHTLDPPMGLTIQMGEQVSLRKAPPDAPDETVSLPAEALMRLISGRLHPDLTPAGVDVTGPVDLDTLRAVFPGY